MSKKLVFLNALMIVTEFLACLSMIAAFAFCGWKFSHWWINLFSLLPLAMFSSRGLFVDMQEDGGDDENAG